MSRRAWIVMGLAVGAMALSGCVVAPVAPVAPDYGYGRYGYGGPPRGVYVVPPPVVVVPPPRHHHEDGRVWRDGEWRWR
jgi:hypothetical protein